MEKNIVIKYQLENIEAFIDKEKFAQVIINILSNAIKFTDNNGNISVFIEADEKYVFIRVKDDGIGISEDIRDEIFNRFVLDD